MKTQWLIPIAVLVVIGAIRWVLASVKQVPMPENDAPPYCDIGD